MNVNGFYDINITTPLGEKFATLHLIADGSKLTGEFITTKAQFPINGTTEGNTVNFKTMIATSMGDVNAQISATVDGDVFSGEAKVLFGKMVIKGTRKIA